MSKKQKTLELDSKGYRKFGIMDKLAYAAGDLGCNMSFGLKGTVQTFWLVYMTMETGLLSALLLLVQIWDAINDPIIGAMIDKDNGKYKNIPEKTTVLEVDGPMFFASSDKIKSIDANDETKVLILRMSNVTALDVTAMQALTGLMLKCRNKNITLLLSHPNEQPMKVLEKSGFDQKIGRENILENIDAALERATEIVIEN